VTFVADNATVVVVGSLAAASDLAAEMEEAKSALPA
jgi:hypothetical protein